MVRNQKWSTTSKRIITHCDMMSEICLKIKRKEKYWFMQITQWTNNAKELEENNTGNKSDLKMYLEKTAVH